MKKRKKKLFKKNFSIRRKFNSPEGTGEDEATFLSCLGQSNFNLCDPTGTIIKLVGESFEFYFSRKSTKSLPSNLVNLSSLSFSLVYREKGLSKAEKPWFGSWKGRRKTFESTTNVYDIRFLTFLLLDAFFVSWKKGQRMTPRVKVRTLVLKLSKRMRNENSGELSGCWDIIRTEKETRPGLTATYCKVLDMRTG